MGLKNTTEEWGGLAKALHWLIALGMVGILYLGLAQSGMERGDEKTFMRFIHASIATVVLILMTIRIVWRFMNDVPGHPPGMAAWQRVTASLVHWGLYIVVMAQLLVGAMIVGTAGSGLPVFGLFSIPLRIAEDDAAHERWEEVHEFLWKPLAVLLILHILGALFNHFVAKNDVLRRMTVGVK